MNKFKNLLLSGFMILGLGVLVSCGSSVTSASNQDEPKKEIITVNHKNGSTDVEKNPEVIVTFDFGALDILDNLGVEVSGVPKTSLPSSMKKYDDDKYTDVGGLKEPDFETINSLKPDLIILGGRQADMYDKFNEIAPTILLSIDGSKYMEDLENNANILGSLFDKNEQVQKKLGEIKSKIDELNKIATEKNSTVLTLLVNEGNISTYGDTSRFGIIYNELGFKQADDLIEDSTHGQQVSFEYVVDKNPDYIFVVDRSSVVTGQGTAHTVLDNDLIKSTQAYKDGNILYLDSEAWYVIAGGFYSTNVMIDEIRAFVEK